MCIAVNILDPDDPIVPQLRARIARNIDRRDMGYTSPCWIWIRGLDDKGYGRVHMRRKAWRAHRVSYVCHVGAIPDGLVIDHLCRNPACVNPEHLEPVRIGENTKRGVGPRIAGDRMLMKTHCPDGHPYSGENLFIAKNGGRICRACMRRRRRESYWRHRERICDERLERYQPTSSRKRPGRKINEHHGGSQ